MMDKNLAEAIARLRGVTSANKPAEKASEPAKPAETPGVPTPPKSGNSENAAVLDSLLAQAPDTPDADKQYTMEDLDNFLKMYIKKD